MFDVRLVLVVGHADRIGRAFGRFKSVGHGERDVLAIVTNHIVIERRAPLYANAVHPLSHDRAEDLSDVRAMKNSAHARHLFRRACVQFGDFAAGDRCLDRNGVQHSGEVEIRGVLRHAAYLQRTIYARRLTTDR